MNLQTRFMSETMTAFLAFERSLAGMDSPVYEQMACVCEFLPAFVAFERSFAAMNARVHKQLARACGFLPAFLALALFNGIKSTSMAV